MPEDEKDTSYYHYYEQEHSYSTYGHNENSIDEIKINKIKECTKYYLYKEKKQFSEIRFDVIEIYQIKEHYVVNHIKNAF